MRLVKWLPRHGELNRVHTNFDEMIRDLFTRPLYAGSVGPVDSAGRAWLPSTDVVEDATRYLVNLDLPGVRREEIKISVNNGTLSIAGERKQENESAEKGYSRIERAYGSFERTFSLPSTVDSNKIEAAYKDGVLTVTLPKSEQARPKAIEVKVN